MFTHLRGKPFSGLGMSTIFPSTDHVVHYLFIFNLATDRQPANHRGSDFPADSTIHYFEWIGVGPAKQLGGECSSSAGCCWCHCTAGGSLLHSLGWPLSVSVGAYPGTWAEAQCDSIQIWLIRDTSSTAIEQKMRAFISILNVTEIDWSAHQEWIRWTGTWSVVKAHA